MATPRKVNPPKSNETAPVNETKPDGAHRIRLKVVGVGGAGGNAVANLATMSSTGNRALAGVELITINTDLQSLVGTPVTERVQIGSAVTRGLGAGSDPEVGARAAQQDTERLEVIVQNADIVFILAGLGGGTGTGAAPVLARIAKEQGALVLGIATLPFAFEGERRRQQALAGLDQLKAQADAVICIPNEKFFKVAGDRATAVEVFQRANDLIATGVQAIWQLLSRKGLVNVDFAALRAALGGKHGDGILSFGEGRGAEKSRDAIKAVMENPILDNSEVLGKAEAVLVSVLGGPDMTLSDVQRAVEPITRLATRAQVIMGAAIDESYRDRLSITLIASAHLLPKRAVPAAQRLVIGRPLPFSGGGPVTPASPPAREPAASPKKEPVQPRQESLPLERVSRGRFDKSEPTLYEGEDLDVPTYLRRGINLRR